MNTDKLKSNRALELDMNGGRFVRVRIFDDDILHASSEPAAPMGGIVSLNTLQRQINNLHIPWNKTFISEEVLQRGGTTIALQDWKQAEFSS